MVFCKNWYCTDCTSYISATHIRWMDLMCIVCPEGQKGFKKFFESLQNGLKNCYQVFLLWLGTKWLYWVFFLGCYTRSVLDAIVSSHSNRAWVDVALPNECMASTTSFWSTKQYEVAQHMSSFDDLTSFNDTLKRSSPHLGKKKWIISNNLYI